MTERPMTQVRIASFSEEANPPGSPVISRRWVVVWAAGLLGACTGAIAPEGPPLGPGPEDDWGSAAATCQVSQSSGRVVARRLDRTEYNNTVRDLFGFDVGRPADDFPDDITGGDSESNNGLIV